MANEKYLYLSKNNINLGYTPENDYDPRYYDLSYVDEDGYYRDEPDPEVIEYIDGNFGELSYTYATGGCIYTENYDVMQFLQEETWYGEPVWFDVVSPDKPVADELRADGWTW